MTTPSSLSMMAVLQLTLNAGAATAACTPSATFVISNLASPCPEPSCSQQSILVVSLLLVADRTAFDRSWPLRSYRFSSRREHPPTRRAQREQSPARQHRDG